MRWIVRWLCFASLALPVVGQARGADAFELRCAAGDGTAVAGAEVFVFQWLGVPGQPGNFVRFGPYRSDEAGRVTCPTGLTFGDGRFDRLAYARVPGRLVGGCRWFALVESHPTVPIVSMSPTRTLTGVVRVPKGFAAGDARVSILSLEDRVGVGDTPLGRPLARVYGIAGLDDALPEVFDAKVAADGTFTLRDLPRDASVHLAIDGPGLAQQQYANLLRPLPEELEFTMVEQSRLDGRVVDPEGHGAAGVRVRVRSTGSLVLTEFRGVTDGEGRFSIGGLPAGPVQVDVEAERSPFVPVPVVARVGAPGSVTMLDVALVAPVVLAGVVVDANSRTPIAEVVVRAIGPDPDRLEFDAARTDELGHFQLRVPPGLVQLSFASIPAGYRAPDPQIVERIHATSRRAELRKLHYELTRVR